MNGMCHLRSYEATEAIAGFNKNQTNDVCLTSAMHIFKYFRSFLAWPDRTNKLTFFQNGWLQSSGGRHPTANAKVIV